MAFELWLETRSVNPFAGGKHFGSVGAYDLISGVAHYSVDPSETKEVVDIGKVPTNADGKVEFTADVHILKPRNLANWNRRIFYDVINRGNVWNCLYFNDAFPEIAESGEFSSYGNNPNTERHAGNGFLMRQGYAVVWSGWDGVILPVDDRVTLTVPHATEGNQPLTGVVRTELSANAAGVHSLPLSGNVYSCSYEPVINPEIEPVLTFRENETDPRMTIPNDRWSFQFPGSHEIDGRKVDPVPLTSLFVEDGFNPGWLYELIYEAKDPPVLGLGFVAVRNLIDYLKYWEKDSRGNENPLYEGSVRTEYAYTWGLSQGGRFLRDFVYLGFNENEQEEKIFDGVWVDGSGSGRMFFNHRFGQPGRRNKQHEEHLFPVDIFPLSYSPTNSPKDNRTDSICLRPKTDPLIFHTNSSTDYWQRRASLVHTSPKGEDLVDPENVRFYLFASAQHFIPPGGIITEGVWQHHPNLMVVTSIMRALLVALDEWVSGVADPPKSQVPMVAEQTLTSPSEVSSRFPSGNFARCPDFNNRLHEIDCGPEFQNGIVTNNPPIVDKNIEYAVLVPNVDVDGHDLAGIKSPEIQNPVGTHVGWNWRKEGFVPTALAGTMGSFLPFSRTKADRIDAQDPRLSIEERYKDHETYVQQIASSAQSLEAQRFLLREDVERYVLAAKKRNPLDQDVELGPFILPW